MNIERSLLYQRILMFTLIVNSVAGVITDEVFDSLAMRNTIQLGVDAVFVMIGLLTLRRWVDLVPLALFIVIGYISSIKGNGLSIVFFANYPIFQRERIPPSAIHPCVRPLAFLVPLSAVPNHYFPVPEIQSRRPRGRNFG